MKDNHVRKLCIRQLVFSIFRLYSPTKKDQHSYLRSIKIKMGNKQGKGRKRAATTSGASSGHSQPKFKAIADNYQSLGEVQQALRGAGLESSNRK